MTDDIYDPQAIKGMQNYSKYIAMVIRNAMEDFHHQNLSDKQMKELNPIIRNAIYTAIYSYESYGKSDRLRDFVEFHLMSIPKYWEEPELVAGVKAGEESTD